jgi:hypothetical protein
MPPDVARVSKASRVCVQGGKIAQNPPRAHA